MELKDVERILNVRPFLFSRLHDYDVVEGQISGLGIYEDSLPYLKEAIGDGWDFIEKRRNPDNGFLRIDIVPIVEESMESNSFGKKDESVKEQEQELDAVIPEEGVIMTEGRIGDLSYITKERELSTEIIFTDHKGTSSTMNVKYRYHELRVYLMDLKVTDLKLLGFGPHAPIAIITRGIFKGLYVHLEAFEYSALILDRYTVDVNTHDLKEFHELKLPFLNLRVEWELDREYFTADTKLHLDFKDNSQEEKFKFCQFGKMKFEENDIRTWKPAPVGDLLRRINAYKENPELFPKRAVISSLHASFEAGFIYEDEYLSLYGLLNK